ncbi:hypothetical protein ACHAQJ_007608 [Trichoderma viride]
MALLIALARQQQLFTDVLADNTPSSVVFTSKLLFTSEDADFLHLYSADVPSSLLDMFERPSVSPPTQPSVSAQVTAIPYKLLDTLGSCILSLVLPESYHQTNRKRKFESQ